MKANITLYSYTIIIIILEGNVLPLGKNATFVVCIHATNLYNEVIIGHTVILSVYYTHNNAL